MNIGKQIKLGLGLAGAVALVVIAGRQLPGEAAAVVIGVVCGVIAGIPTSLLLLVALTRRDQRPAEEWRQTRPDYPPVVVIQAETQLTIPGEAYDSH